ncbi:MAG: hypothetical protein HY973_00650 [Candidatus Kerfeldbacteria bacterium]|nr:hypothetical protein [Candidatus Kerfeldbacteria bacterium]
MSKFLIRQAYNYVYYGNYSYDYDWSNWYKDDHARAVVVADIVIKKDRVLRVLNNHGNYSKEKIDSPRSLKECQHIKQQAQLCKGPVIIAGDFNLHPNTQSIKILNKVFTNLTSKYKLESTLPINDGSVLQLKNVIDYIFANKQVIVKDFRVVKTSVSDHYSLILDFELKK